MNYNNFDIEDFIHDAFFREWVLNNTPDSKRFWEAWLLQNPDKKETIETAKTLVQSLDIKEIPLNAAEIERGIANILHSVKAERTLVVPFYKRSWFRMAATIALLVTAGFWWFNNSYSDQNNGKTTAYTEGVKNNEDKPLTVTLPDGSTVILQKNSEIHYAKTFDSRLREVQFKGEGLFDVVENPHKPFVVYSGAVVTKVLGTSFIVKAFDKDNKVTVNVIRGKVSVTALTKQQDKQVAKPEVILTPNQKAVFSKNEDLLEQTLADAPIAIPSKDTLQQLSFEETPVKDIFASIEKNYNVDIVFDEKTLKNCALTTVIGDETLYEELNLICKIIGASYQVVGVQVIVSGKACQ
jgi:ferric-dicitrate binding protein FerR (iron transport regulator)